MGSLAVQPAVSALHAPDITRDMTAGPTVGGACRPIPELAEATFISQVLATADGDHRHASEAEIDEALAARAAALGISTTAVHAPNPGQPHGPRGGRSIVPELNRRARANSSASDAGTDTAASTNPRPPRPTPPEPATPAREASSSAISRRRSRNLSFSRYDKYLADLDPNLKQPKFMKDLSSSTETAPSIFSISTRKSIISLKRSIKNKVRWKRGPSDSAPLPISCICCRDDFSKIQSLQTLPCGHTYCCGCLRIMINQSITDESKMPPRCCTQPIPGPIIRAVLGREEQQAFLKAVLEFATPWEARIFCPNSACGEFIPPRRRIDPKHPFDVVCRRCRTHVCVMCKREAHPLGQDCPADWELDAVLKMGEKSGWRRCYKCRSLVELSQGCTHMTCRCKAQFCYICGAVWDGAVGCPNYCNGEEELERRRLEEEARMAELEAEKEARELAAEAEEAERVRAAELSAASPEFAALGRELEAEMERFVAHERKTRWIVWSRHTQERLLLLDRFSEQVEKMRERHAKTAQHLEDRQIAAEMDLRVTLEQRARSVKIRLRHMEAYCDGLGRNVTGRGSEADTDDVSAVGGADSISGGVESGQSSPRCDDMMPARVVTERDLRELGQQYNMRDDLERLHQARINVLRDRQAKNMEALQERQEAEMGRLLNRRDEEIEDLEAGFAAEDDALLRTFEERRARARRRWELRVEILQKEMEEKTGGLRHGPIPVPDWPPSPGSAGGGGEEVEDGGSLSVVDE